MRLRVAPALDCFLPPNERRASAIFLASSSVMSASWPRSAMIHSSGGRSRPAFVWMFHTAYPQYCISTCGCSRAYHVEIPQYCFRRPGIPALSQNVRSSSSDAPFPASSTTRRSASRRRGPGRRDSRSRRSEVALRLRIQTRASHCVEERRKRTSGRHAPADMTANAPPACPDQGPLPLEPAENVREAPQRGSVACYRDGDAGRRRKFLDESGLPTRAAGTDTAFNGCDGWTG